MVVGRRLNDYIFDRTGTHSSGLRAPGQQRYVDAPRTNTPVVRCLCLYVKKTFQLWPQLWMDYLAP